MTTRAESPLGPAKKGIKWNNVFSPGHRRSRSWTGLNKTSVVEAMRSSTSLGALSARDGEAPSLTSPNYGPAIAEEEEQEGDRTPGSTSVSPKTSISQIPPARPKPAPRLWTDSSVAENTLRGLETVIAPSPVQFHTVQNSLSQETRPSTPSMGNEVRSLISKFSAGSNARTLSMRRKGSVAELDLGPAKKARHVTQTISDSPAFTGRSSRPDRRTPETTAPTKDCPTPRAVASDPQLSETRQVMEPALRTPVWDERSQRRASSMLLPVNLAPVVIPSMPPRAPPVLPLEPLKTDFQAAVQRRPAKTLEQPPKVPPKSPRTLLRAFPVPKSSVTSSDTPSTSHTANSSISSIGPTETPMTATTNTAWSPMEQIASPSLLRPESESPIVHSGQSSRQTDREAAVALNDGSNSKDVEDRAMEMQPTFLPRNAYTGGSIKHSRSNSSLAATISSSVSSSSTQLQGQHQRMTSDSSVLNRGRPMKRGDVTLQRSVSRSLKMALINGSFAELPRGYRKGQIPYAVLNGELFGLRRDAEEHVSGYEVLTQLQIANLNQELRLLEENCEQVRQTIAGLREGRRGILRGMRLHLNTPGNVQSLRDQISKQEVALTDIDESMDEWTTKLEAALNQKQLVQAKLMQHTAAVLTLPSPRSEGGRVSEEQTPPRSPERKMVEQVAEEMAEEQPGQERSDREVESITIYADSGVASLLRSIEQEIDMMDQSRRHGQ